MDIKPRNNRSRPGVTRRQSRQRIGDFDRPKMLNQAEIKEGRTVVDPVPMQNQEVAESFQLDTSDIEDNVETKEKKHFWHWLKPSFFRRNFNPRLFFKRVGLVSGTLVLFVLGYLGFKLFFAAQNIIDRDSGGALALQGDASLLNGEGDGRVNILMIGIGGEQHQGGDLADTIIVASIDPFNNEVAMLSVPRDLYVPIEGYHSTKINEAHYAGELLEFERAGYPSGGPGLLQLTIEQTLGIPIHYFTRVDFDGFEQAINAVGSVDVNVPETVCDYTIAWQFGFDCINSGLQNMNSNQALFYARTRASARGDFDRGARQRLILLALKDEILSTDTFANPVRVSSLLDSAGNHARTNLQVGEMLRVYEIIQNIPQDKFISSGLDDYVSTANIGGASVVVTKSGDFTEIQRFVRSIFIDGLIKQEAATIDVLNGTAVTGLAQTHADELKSYGYNVVTVGDTDEKGFSVTRLYAVNAGSAPVTERYLEQRLGTVALPARDLPEGITSTSAFVIILGNDATR